MITRINLVTRTPRCRYGTKTFLEEGFIDKKTRIILSTNDAVSPRIYELPKIHRDGCPLRPIVSCINNPTHALSKFLSNILYNSIDQDKYKIKNLHQFKTCITTQTIPDDFVLISLDVVSLLTIIPLSLALENIDRRWNNIKSHTDNPLHRFKKIIQFVVSSNNFFYNGDFYYQTSRTPMGSCLSPSLADLVMDTLLNEVTKRLDFDLQFIRKYVDDSITAVPSTKVQASCDTLNSYNDHLQFTVECEVDGKIPFLDLSLVRNPNDGSITTTCYMKPISSGRILNYYSSHSNNQIMGTAIGLIQRAIRLTSNFNQDMLNIIFRLLRNNNYPFTVINKLVNQQLSKLRTLPPETITDYLTVTTPK